MFIIMRQIDSLFGKSINNKNFGKDEFLENSNTLVGICVVFYFSFIFSFTSFWIPRFVSRSRGAAVQPDRRLCAPG